MIHPTIPGELKGKALLDFIVKNEDLILHSKKSAMKRADSIPVSNFLSVNERGAIVSKAMTDAEIISPDATKMMVDLCINTTNYFDSHYDVHIPGLWSKSLKDNAKTGYYLLNRHKQNFEDVIGESLAGKTTKLSWKDLGFDFTGITEALMFSGTIDKARNPFMFDQYAKRYVKQHSVGMYYVKIVTCINDDDYPVQKENWDKYFPMVINADDADEAGFFWAVLEAKVTEGSAVLFGSNDLTPTMAVTESKTTSNSTEEGAVKDTPGAAAPFDILKAIANTNFLT